MWPERSVDPAALAATLAQLDVPYLRTPTSAEPLPLDPAGLIAALAQHPAPRRHFTPYTVPGVNGQNVPPI